MAEHKRFTAFEIQGILGSDVSFLRPDTLGVELIVNNEEEYEIDAHQHPFFELLYIVRGTRCLSMGGRTYKASPGHLLVFRPGEVHAEFSGSRSISFVTWRIHPSDLDYNRLQFPETSEIGPVIPLQDKQDRLVQLAQRIHHERINQAPDSPLLLGAYLVELVVTLHRSIQQVRGELLDLPRACIPGAERAVRALDGAPVTGMRVPELARNALMSESQLYQLCKATLGEGPKTYLVNKRIERAQQLLEETEQHAGQIAQLLGYKSPHFFCRQFKQKTGMTPTEYRTRCREAVKQG
jgi:AraC family transcriptional regulator, arabinose operon regulatory protein